MASNNTLIILDRIDEKGFAHNRYKKILYDGGYHWMKLLSLRTLLVLPIFDFFETEFIITDKGILISESAKYEYFWFDNNFCYRAHFSVLGLLFNYGTFTLSHGGGGFGARPTEYIYKKVRNAKLFKSTLDSLKIKRVE